MVKRVIGLIYASENYALADSSYCYTKAFEEAGFESEIIDLGLPEGGSRLKERLLGGEVAFCFGLQGVGSRLTVGGGASLWTAQKTPFVCLHFDHPCHNPFNHRSDSPFVGNLYHYQSFLETKQNYLPSRQISEYTPITFIFKAFPEPKAPFEKRPIKFLFLKSGAPLTDEKRYLGDLPPQIRMTVMEQLGRTEQSPDLQICDLVNEVLLRHNLDRMSMEDQFWDLVRVMDRYLRRKRAIDMVEWLKFQEGAVIIGDGWDFVDKSNARAEFRPATHSFHANNLYEQSQFVCNVNPYGRDIVHERVLYGLASGCCVISDSNQWWDKNFADVPALARFGWHRPLDEQLRPMIGDMNAAAKAASIGRSAALSAFAYKGVGPIIAFAGKIRQFAQNNGF